MRPHVKGSLGSPLKGVTTHQLRTTALWSSVPTFMIISTQDTEFSF